MRKVTLWSAEISVDFSVSLGVGCLRAGWASAEGDADNARDRRAKMAPNRNERANMSQFSLTMRERTGSHRSFVDACADQFDVIDYEPRGAMKAIPGRHATSRFRLERTGRGVDPRRGSQPRSGFRVDALSVEWITPGRDSGWPGTRNVIRCVKKFRDPGPGFPRGQKRGGRDDFSKAEIFFGCRRCARSPGVARDRECPCTNDGGHRQVRGGAVRCAERVVKGVAPPDDPMAVMVLNGARPGQDRSDAQGPRPDSRVRARRHVAQQPRGRRTPVGRGRDTGFQSRTVPSTRSKTWAWRSTTSRASPGSRTR